MSALKFVISQPALAPLFVAVGMGVVGSVGFGYYYLSNSPDVVLRKKTQHDPWNSVSQDRNTKLFSYNPDFWKAQAKVADPRMSFMKEGETEKALESKRKAKVIKDEVVGH